jgi:1-acyl-sn-glycerol-3-phosphate acyltransferase
VLGPPHRVVRRVLIAPALVVGFAAVAAALPLVLIGAAFLSRYVPGKWRILRIVWFLFLYMAVEAIALTAMFVFWVASGFGAKIPSAWWQTTHYHLLAWMLRRVVASAKFTFRITIVREGDPPRTVGGRARPVLVLSRHAGPGDSLLLMDALANGFRRRPRIVLKEFLQWDPAIDVILNRLPSAFVPAQGGREELLGVIFEMAGTMGGYDAFVIFPEGGNFTPGRHLRSIEKLREIGRPDLAERAEALKNTLPPRATGVKTALAAIEGPADVFFVGHAGLEAFEGIGDIWRGMPIGTEVDVRVWHYPAELVPAPDEQEAWLFDVWSEIDEWISLRLDRTQEPFDDPESY